MYCARCNSATRPGQRYCTQCGTPLVMACARCYGVVFPSDVFCGNCGVLIAQVGVVPPPQALLAGAGGAAQWPAATVPYGVPNGPVGPVAQSPVPMAGVPPASQPWPVAPVQPGSQPMPQPQAVPWPVQPAGPPRPPVGEPGMVGPPTGAEAEAPELAPTDEDLDAPEPALTEEEAILQAQFQARIPIEVLARAQADALAQAGEKRTATVLMADVKGFTSLSERLPIEAVTDVMGAWFDRVAEIILHHEGYPVKTTGDCVMACFGVPIAVEQAPERAIRAALAMQEAIGDLRVEGVDMSGVQLSVRIGINTGEVVALGMMADGKPRFDLMGPTVNIASRLESVAPVGGILVSEAVYRRCKDQFEFEFDGAKELHNVSEPVSAYVVKAEKARRRGPAPETMAPLVGRATQLSALSDALRLALQGSGQVVSIVGEAGVGKSRLAYEIRRSAEAAGASWAEGHCLTYGAQVAYMPFQEILREAAGIEPLDDEDDQRRKLDTMLREALGDDAAALGPQLGAAIQVAYPGSDFERVTGQDRAQAIHEAIEEYLQQRSARAPVVVVLDDAQWIDSSSEEILQHLTQDVAGRPILLIVSHRPSYEPQLTVPHYRRIELQRLSPDESDVLLSRHLGDVSLPANVRRKILERADGNPFYLAEMVRALQAEGALDSGEGVSLDMVPDSLQEIIHSRLDHLPPDARRLLDYAAVIAGARFSSALLGQVADLDRRKLATCLALLRDQQFIVAVESSAGREGDGGDTEYRFEHNLVLEQIRDTMLVRTRVGIHCKVAEAMEELYDERKRKQHSPELAYHFDNGGIPEKAIDYYVDAAGQHLDNAVFVETTKACARAFELLSGLEPVGENRSQAAQLCVTQCQAQGYLGKLDEAMQSAKRALELALTIRDASLEGQAYERLAFVWGELGDYDAAKQYYRLGLRVYEYAANEAGVRQCRQGVISILYKQGDYEGALRGYEQELEQYRAQMARKEEPAPSQLAAVLSNMGSTLNELGEYRRALEYLGEAEAITDAHSDRFGEAYLWANMGLAHLALGRYATAHDEFGRAVERFREMGYRLYEGLLIKDVARCNAELARYEDSLNAAREALEIGRELGIDFLQVDAMTVEAKASLHLGLLDSALDISRRALEMARVTGATQGEADCALVCGEVVLARGEPDRALEDFGRALQRGREMKNRLVEANALIGHGQAWLAQGKFDEALATFEEALGVATPMGVQLSQIDAHLGTARAHWHRDKLGAAEKRFAQALELAGEIGHVRCICDAALGLARLKRRLGERQPSLDFYVRTRAAAKTAVEGCGTYAERCLPGRRLLEIETEMAALCLEMRAIDRPAAGIPEDLLDLIAAPSADMDQLRRRSPEVSSLLERLLSEPGRDESRN